jgi:hypothetical protein
MTATPRYIKEHIKRRAAELDYELVSMDDEHAFGPEFHVLTFHEAITANPPLLTDYQVVVIGVTDREARKWVEQGHLVHTEKGLKTDARSLAARIGLAKAMKRYDLRRIISFHSSVAKAERFVDTDRDDSLPAVLPHLSRSSRPTGRLWARHISGHTPAGKRRTLLRGLGELPERSRGIVSNCACLGEGVDVPVLDGVAFIDPKRSMVDIIQAVGRVIRKAEGKQIGTVVVPVLIDESQDPDSVLSQSAFEPVWQVLKALRAHDRRLADELDHLRLKLGRETGSRGRLVLPAQIRLDVPQLLLKGFEQAFYARTVEATTTKPSLTIEQILEWADAHEVATGDWPNQKSGQVTNTDETWGGINAALQYGNRGLPGGSTLARLLAEHRDVQNIQDLPPLAIEQILAWAEVHVAASGRWPKVNSGQVMGTRETWAGINAALSRGNRGLPGDSTLARLFAEHRGVRNAMDLPPLTIKQILGWADEHRAATGQWPNKQSGQVTDTNETWGGINSALRKGSRGLAIGTTLADLLEEHRQVRNVRSLPPLTIEWILERADEHNAATGDWPNEKSGLVRATEETWAGINAALSRGNRGLPGGSTLARLLAGHRDKRNIHDLSPLTIEQVLTWADEHRAATGQWPNKQSRQVMGTCETWAGIDAALSRGNRGLPGDSTLARLLAEHRGVRNRMDLPPLSIEQILAWVDAHKVTYGEWPNRQSGQVRGTKETWARINDALLSGYRSFPGGSSLAKLLAEHRGKRNLKDLSPLTIEQILVWVDAYKAATGNWPNMKSGQVTGTDETWAAINHSLRLGYRGFPGGSSLAKLLAEQRR